MDVDTTVSLRDVENASFRRAMSGDLFGGFYGGSLSGDLQMSYDGPRGTTMGETLYNLAAAGPGDYTFRVDHDFDSTRELCDGGEGMPPIPCRLPWIWVFGADVRMP